MTEPDHIAQSASAQPNDSLSDQALQGITASWTSTSIDGGKSTLIVVFKSDDKTATSQVFVRSLKTWQADLDELDGHITSLASFADKIQGEGSILYPGKFHRNDDGVTLARSLDGDTWTLSRPGLRELCFTLGEVTEPKAPSPAASKSEGGVKFNPMDSDSDGSSLSPPPASPEPEATSDMVVNPSAEDEPYFEEESEEEACGPGEPDDEYDPQKSGAESVSDDDPMDVDGESDNEEYISPGDAASDSSLDRAKTAQRRLQVPRPGSSRARPRSARSTSINKRPLEEVDDPQSGPSSGTEPEAVETADEAASSSDDSKDEAPVQKFRTVPGYSRREPSPVETGSEKDAEGDEVSVTSEEL